MMSHFIEDSLYYGLFYHRWIHPAVSLPVILPLHRRQSYLLPVLLTSSIGRSVIPHTAGYRPQLRKTVPASARQTPRTPRMPLVV